MTAEIFLAPEKPFPYQARFNLPKMLLKLSRKNSVPPCPQILLSHNPLHNCLISYSSIFPKIMVRFKVLSPKQHLQHHQPQLLLVMNQKSLYLFHKKLKLPFLQLLTFATHQVKALPLCRESAKLLIMFLYHLSQNTL